MEFYAFVIPALRRLKQENYEFQASLGHIASLCLKATMKAFPYHPTITGVLSRDLCSLTPRTHHTHCVHMAAHRESSLHYLLDFDLSTFQRLLPAFQFYFQMPNLFQSGLD